MREEQGRSNQKQDPEIMLTPEGNAVGVPAAEAGSDNASGEGAIVLQEVVRMTGLSSEFLDGAISGLLGRPESSVNDLSLDELRNLLLECLESMNEQMGSEPTESKIN